MKFSFKYILAAILVVFAINSIKAQQKAITETGEEVVLYNNGTWKFQKDVVTVKEIFTNPNTFIKPEKSTFLVKSLIIKNGVYINPTNWTFNKAVINKTAEYEFKHKKLELNAFLICDTLEVDLIKRKDLALENIKKVAPEMAIVKEEFRTVNGLKVLYVQMSGMVNKTKSTYVIYYYTAKQRNIQFVSYFAGEINKVNETACQELLNGLVELK